MTEKRAITFSYLMTKHKFRHFCQWCLGILTSHNQYNLVNKKSINKIGQWSPEPSSQLIKSKIRDRSDK